MTNMLAKESVVGRIANSELTRIEENARFAACARESLKRCQGQGMTLFDKFYRTFLDRHPAIQKKFSQTNFATQRQLLRHALYMLVTFAEGDVLAQPIMEQLRNSHGYAGYDIEPWMYDEWTECLIEAIRETDGCCTDEVLEAWRYCLKIGITFMRTGSRETVESLCFTYPKEGVYP